MRQRWRGRRCARVHATIRLSMDIAAVDEICGQLCFLNLAGVNEPAVVLVAILKQRAVRHPLVLLGFDDLSSPSLKEVTADGLS